MEKSKKRSAFRRWQRHFRKRMWKTLLRCLDVSVPFLAGPTLTTAQQEKIKSLLEPGDILLETNARYPGWQLAALLTLGSNWMHSAIYIGNGQVIDVGTEPYVSKIPLDVFLKTTHIAIYRPSYLTTEDRQTAIRFVTGKIGAPFNVTFDTADKHSFYCTQLISSALLAMPNPIPLPKVKMLWKEVVGPKSITNSDNIKLIWTTRGSSPIAQFGPSG